MSASFLKSRTAPVAAALALALLSGCAQLQRDHIEVGSVPDDYRTNHPIIIGEKAETLDLAVAADGYRVTRHQQDTVAGFMHNYDRKAAPPVTIMVPAGSANAAAASSVASELGNWLRHKGIRHVQVSLYEAQSPDVSAPLRIVYTGVRAYTDKCGRRPADLLADNSENKHYADFGCSYQNNLAAQVANPNDLVGPRRPTEIDAENRAVAIGDYQAKDTTFTPGTGY